MTGEKAAAAVLARSACAQCVPRSPAHDAITHASAHACTMPRVRLCVRVCVCERTLLSAVSA
ncbi:hypothetical protein EON67_00290 [archaeon]|nr:MAG: hypothetical protein EON67_00290 [archaeon]